MVIITNATTGNNVYYSTYYGVTFLGVSVGTTPLVSCDHRMMVLIVLFQMQQLCIN
jgi:hypothetical protein